MGHVNKMSDTSVMFHQLLVALRQLLLGCLVGGCSWLGPQVQIKKCLVVLGMHGSVCALLQNQLNAMYTSVMSIQLYGYTPETVSTFYER